MEDIEQIRERRDNIEAIEPIVTSMRTISAGSWRQALQRREASTSFAEYLRWVLSSTVHLVPQRSLQALGVRQGTEPPRRPLLVVISSQRGLCGAYNDLVARGADQLITSQAVQSDEVQVGALGGRGAAYLRRLGRQISLEWPLPTSRVATMDLVNQVASDLREEMSEGTTDAVYILYSPYRAGTLSPVVSERWLPVDESILPRTAAEGPEIIIEGDPVALFQRALTEWTTARLYRMIIEAAAGEQAARYRAMDTASSNLARVIEELTLQYHSARQHAITMEMLDLAAGAEGTRGQTQVSDI